GPRLEAARTAASATRAASACFFTPGGLRDEIARIAVDTRAAGGYDVRGNAGPRCLGAGVAYGRKVRYAVCIEVRVISGLRAELTASPTHRDLFDTGNTARLTDSAQEVPKAVRFCFHQNDAGPGGHRVSPFDIECGFLVPTAIPWRRLTTVGGRYNLKAVGPQWFPSTVFEHRELKLARKSGEVRISVWIVVSVHNSNDVPTAGRINVGT